MTKTGTLQQRVLRRIGHQLWLPGRDRILRAFADPDTHRPEPFETDLFGIPYVGDLSNFIDWTVFFSGAFAGEELHLLADLASAIRAQGKPVNFFDVGANIGHHTVFMSRHADRIFSFEPFHAVRDKMESKLRHASVSNVTVFPVALGERNETGSFRPPIGCNQGTGTLSDNLPDNASSETIPVTVVRGDDFFAANHLPTVSILKMDVEDYELPALRGLRETLRRDRPPILVEIPHEQIAQPGEDMATALDALLYPDHRIFAVDRNRSGQYVLSPFGTTEADVSLILPGELASIFPGRGTRAPHKAAATPV